MRLSRGVPLAAAVPAAGVTWPAPAAAASGAGGHGTGKERLRVPGAAFQQTACPT